MRKIYTFFAVMVLVAFTATTAQELLIDENFAEWPLTQEEQVREFMDWDYTTPDDVFLQFKNSRYTEQAANIVDIQAYNASCPGEPEETCPGQMLFTVASASKIELTFRSASNNNEPDRWMYITMLNEFDEWEKVSEDLPITWGEPHTLDTGEDIDVTEETTFAVMVGRIEGGGGAGRLHGFRVWAAVVNSVDANSKANVSIYTVPGNIRIGGDVVNVEVINLAGSTVLTSSTRGFQSIATSSLPNGVYLVKATDSNGLQKVEKVVIR